MSGEPPRPPSRSSKEFGDEIRQLEIEGSKLLSATSALQDSLGASASRVSKQGTKLSPGFSSEKLTELTDITAEQRAIDTLNNSRLLSIGGLSAQLDAQSMETERISRTYLGDKGFRYASTGSLLDRLEIPTSAAGDAVHGSVTRSYSAANGGGLILPTKSFSSHTDYTLPQPSSAVEQELREARKEVSDLRCRLSEALRSSEKQREEWRISSEQLTKQLQEAVIHHDNVLQTRHRENMGQETLIHKLQATVEQLEQGNRQHEKALMEMNSRLETSQRDSFEVETGLNAVRGMLLEREHARGKMFNPTVSVTQQDLRTLVSSLQACVSEMSTELDKKDRELSRLANEVEDKKLIAKEREDELMKEHKQKLMDVSEQHEAAMNSFSERSVNAKQQVASLQEQLSLLQQQMEMQLKMKQDHIDELELRIQSMKQQVSEDNDTWRNRREGLEKALDESNKELALTKTERDSLIREMAAVQSRHDDMQKTIDSLTESLVCERDKLGKKSDEAGQLLLRVEALTEANEDKAREARDLQQAMLSLQEEHQTQLQQAVSELQREGKEKSEQKTSTLSLQLNAMTDKCQRLSMDLELTKSHLSALTERHNELKTKHEKLRDESVSNQTSKEQASSLLKDRIHEVERLTQEKEGCLKLIDERNKELSSIQLTKEKLSVQLQEREKNFLALQHQYDKTCEISELSSQSMNDLRKERDELNQRINEKIIETEEIRRARDSLNKKLRHRDRHIIELEMDNQRLVEENKADKSRVELMTREKEGVVGELKESRYEVANLQQEKESLVKKYEAQAAALTKEVSRLKHHLKETDSELKVARKALKSREGMDDKAMKVAGKMQKAVTEKRGEIDHLQSRVRWLEECVEAVNKDKKSAEEESTQLSVTVQKTLHQNERLSAELKSYVTRNHELNASIKQLRADLEKSNIKQATVKAQAEEYEQELTRLKLKHKLELKELERTGQLSRHKHLSPQKPDNTTKTNVHISSSHPAVKSGPVKSVTLTSDFNTPVRDRAVKVRKSNVSAAKVASSHISKSTGHRNVRSKPSSNRGRERKTSGITSPIASSRLHGPSPDLSLTSVTSMALTPEKVSVAERDGRVSPVSDLLTSSVVCPIISDTEASITLSDTEASDLINTSYKPGKTKAVLKTDTKELCKRLERKMEMLTRMGGKLKKENADMAKIMKQEDSKLRRIKTQMSR